MTSTPQRPGADEMFLCPKCEGYGWKLWMHGGKPHFLRCLICAGCRTVTWWYGVQPRPPLQPEFIRSHAR